MHKTGLTKPIKKANCNAYHHMLDRALVEQPSRLQRQALPCTAWQAALGRVLVMSAAFLLVLAQAAIIYITLEAMSPGSV